MLLELELAPALAASASAASLLARASAAASWRARLYSVTKTKNLALSAATAFRGSDIVNMSSRRAEVAERGASSIEAGAAGCEEKENLNEGVMEPPPPPAVAAPAPPLVLAGVLQATAGLSSS